MGGGLSGGGFSLEGPLAEAYWQRLCHVYTYIG